MDGHDILIRKEPPVSLLVCLNIPRLEGGEVEGDERFLDVLEFGPLDIEVDTFGVQL